MKTATRAVGPTISPEKAADQLASLLADHLPVAQLQAPILSAVGPHVCSEPGCGRQFNRKYTLVEHMKTHTGEKPHVCPVRTCKKRFSTSGNLSRHKRLHGFIQPIECPVAGCICTFPSDNKLEKHMKFHLGSPVQVCTVGTCGKTFSTMGNLNRHAKQHHQYAAHRPFPPPPPRFTNIPWTSPLTTQAPRFQAPVHGNDSTTPQITLSFGEMSMPNSTASMIPRLASQQHSSEWMAPAPNSTLQQVQVHTPTAFSRPSGGMNEVAPSVFDALDYSHSVSKSVASSPHMHLQPPQAEHFYHQQPALQSSVMHADRVNLFDDMITFNASSLQL